MHTGAQTSFTGFDCRGCGGPIPVFAGAAGATLGGNGSIHIMCPDCGHSGRYAGSEAYRFAGRYRMNRERSSKAA